MKPIETIDQAKTHDGQDLVLYHRDGAYQIRVDGMELMSSRAHGSEAALSELTQEALARVAAPRILVGGLGMGFTLRAALDCFPAQATLVVAEVFAEVVKWNRGPLAHLAKRPLDDPRVRLRQADVAEVLREGPYDGILLDVDNGPQAFTLEANARLYGARGIARLRDALSQKGVLSLWSAGDEPAFERGLKRAGFSVNRVRVPARGRGGGPRHTIYLAKKAKQRRRRPKKLKPTA